MIIDARAPVKLIPRPDFRPEEFRKRIFSHGLPVQWEQSSECPCSSSAGAYGFQLDPSIQTQESLSANRIDCPACKGRGYFFHSSQEIRAIITHTKTDDERFGPLSVEYGRGVVGVTTLPDHLPSLGDRFTLLASLMVMREVIKYEGGNESALRYPIAIKSHDLAAGPVSFGVRYMIHSNDQGVVDPLSTLEEGQDFTITNAGLIQWINAPPLSSRVAVEYYAHPSYIVLNHPHSIRDTRINFKSAVEYHAPLPVYSEAGLEFMRDQRA